ncbi:MAG TPA: UvrD-helicase domain-containing protein, partial [Alphaproteobacteria bacterium]|nr:UvrD-helicase domain-containing protein [Alphaproteobacteria bacterium]
MVENRPDPNLSQRIAANPAVSAWVDASAGSGKTKVLTDRVLALLLQSARPHAILCLTFTKAAAGEMANRIAGRLSSWARMDEPALAEDLASLGGRTPDGETLDRARRLFARVQEAPGGVRIDTMHAFCQGVLQRFPVEAKVPPHFAVLDERDQRTLLAQARDGLVLEIARHPDTPLAQAWERVLARLSESTFAKLMGELVKNRPLLLKAQASDIAHALEVPAEATTETLVRSACEDAAFDGPGLRSLIQPMLEGSATVQKIAGSLSTWLENTAGHRDFKALCAALLNKDGTPTKLERFNPFKSNFALHELIQTEQARLVDVWDELSRAEALADTEALLTVAKQLLTRYEQAKRIRSQLDYDDLIEGAARLLVDPGAAWVHYKLDEGIDHVLVDEAQDTSPPQWQVIAGLIEEFFAGESVNERHRTFFAVGDPKQSIYSFQGADPHEFRKRRQEFSTQA